jgi:hypothetical protein
MIDTANDATEPALDEKGLRKDGAPIGAPPPSKGWDSDGKAIGEHWSPELKRWAKNRGKYKGGSDSAPKAEPKPDAGNAPQTANPSPPTGNPTPNVGPIPETREQKRARWNAKAAEMSKAADAYEDFVLGGIHAANDVMFKDLGIDLFKLPCVGFRLDAKGDVKLLTPKEDGANVAENLGRAMSEIAGGLVPGLLDWPYAAPLLSLSINFAGMVLISRALLRHAEVMERARQDAKARAENVARATPPAEGVRAEAAEGVEV